MKGAAGGGGARNWGAVGGGKARGWTDGGGFAGAIGGGIEGGSDELGRVGAVGSTGTLGKYPPPESSLAIGESRGETSGGGGFW